MASGRPRPARPTKEIFDPFNSSATGHQRADNRLSGSTSWRDSRSLKLKNQFNSGAGGGKRMSDTVGAGSLDFGKDGRTANGGWVKGAKGLRTGGQQSIFESMKIDKDTERPAKRIKNDSNAEPTVVVNPYTPFTKANGSIRETSWTSHETSPSHLLSPIDPNISFEEPPGAEDTHETEETTTVGERLPQVFASLNIYVNGSTAPLISDHKLKRLLTSHGAGISIALGRRTVTHVIIGRPNSSGGSGGGLSGSKLQKEISRTGGNKVKYVTAEWVVESIRAGKRLPEAKFAALSVAPKGVNSVASMFEQRQGGEVEAKAKEDAG